MVRNLNPWERSGKPFPHALLPRTFHRAILPDPTSKPDVPYVVTLLKMIHHLERVDRRRGEQTR